MINKDATKKQEDSGNIEFVILKLEDQYFGILVEKIRDILAPQVLSNIPLTPVEIAGSLNLRGKIVTALDTKMILGFANKIDPKEAMNIVIEHQEDNLYSFLVDKVNEVFNISKSAILPNPENMSNQWQRFSLGLYPNNGNLVIILDTNKMINYLLNRG